MYRVSLQDYTLYLNLNIIIGYWGNFQKKYVYPHLVFQYMVPFLNFHLGVSGDSATEADKRYFKKHKIDTCYYDNIRYNNVCGNPTPHLECYYQGGLGYIVDYRYHETDSSGCDVIRRLIDKTSSLQEVDQLDLVQIYPNPTHTYLYLSSPYRGCSVMIQDMTGKIVFSASHLDREASLNVLHLPANTYSIFVMNQSGRLLHRQLFQKQ